MRNKDALFTSDNDDHRTPRRLFDELNKEFHFDLDPCTFEDNPLGTKHFFTKEIDGLKQDWDFAKSIFINPPFKTIDKWVQKASESVASNPGQVIVMLIAARTDTQRFHKYIYNKPNVETRFLPGRLKFEGTKNSAPFPSMVVIFR